MAITKSVTASGIKAVFIDSAIAGAGAAVYTVPEGKVFKGTFRAQNANTNISININGTSATFQIGNGNEMPEISITLPPTTTVTNTSTQYFIISGELFDGS
jgi:hypothetical protein